MHPVQKSTDTEVFKNIALSSLRFSSYFRFAQPF